MSKIRMINGERNFEGDAMIWSPAVSKKATICLSLFSNIALAFRNSEEVWKDNDAVSRDLLHDIQVSTG